MIIYRDALPVAVEPVEHLWRWQIMTLPDGEQHFCGFRSNGTTARISSRIVAYDAVSQTGHTQSGRCYHLEGPSSDDALPAWRVWCQLQGIDPAS